MKRLGGALLMMVALAACNRAPDNSELADAEARGSREAAEGGAIGLVENGDLINIDIPSRTIVLAVADSVLAERRAAMEAKGDAAWQPVKPRPRKVSVALQAYAAMTTSAARGAVRDLSQLKGKG